MCLGGRNSDSWEVQKKKRSIFSGPQIRVFELPELDFQVLTRDYAPCAGFWRSRVGTQNRGFGRPRAVFQATARGFPRPRPHPDLGSRVGTQDQVQDPRPGLCQAQDAPQARPRPGPGCTPGQAQDQAQGQAQDPGQNQARTRVLGVPGWVPRSSQNPGFGRPRPSFRGSQRGFSRPEPGMSHPGGFWHLSRPEPGIF